MHVPGNGVPCVPCHFNRWGRQSNVEARQYSTDRSASQSACDAIASTSQLNQSMSEVAASLASTKWQSKRLICIHQLTDQSIVTSSVSTAPPASARPGHAIYQLNRNWHIGTNLAKILKSLALAISEIFGGRAKNLPEARSAHAKGLWHAANTKIIINF